MGTKRHHYGNIYLTDLETNIVQTFNSIRSLGKNFNLNSTSLPGLAKSLNLKVIYKKRFIITCDNPKNIDVILKQYEQKEIKRREYIDSHKDYIKNYHIKNKNNPLYKAKRKIHNDELTNKRRNNPLYKVKSQSYSIMNYYKVSGKDNPEILQALIKLQTLKLELKCQI